MDDNLNEKYYFFCDESGNDAEHPAIGCVIVKEDDYNNLLNAIKQKYYEYEKENEQFEEIHFACFKDKERDNIIQFVNNVINCIVSKVSFYALILNEKIDNNNKKDHYYNVLLNKMFEDFDIKQFQIDKIVIDRYKKQDKQKIGNFECNFVNSKHKISKSDFSYFLQICDCLIGSVRHIKNNNIFVNVKYKKNDIRNNFCSFIKDKFELDNLITITKNWIVKEYKK